MAVTFEDQFDVSAELEHGRVVRLVRAGYVAGLTSTDPDDYVAEIAASGAIPRSAITVNGSVLWYKSESVSIGDDVAKGDARVDITYERGSGSVAADGTTVVPELEWDTTLKQVRTQVDAAGDQITVSHAWPAGATGVYPDGTKKENTTETQGGEITVLVPMTSVRGKLRVQTNDPGSITRSYVGKLNETKWQGGVARTWMCTRAGGRLVDDSQATPIYDLSFQFDYDAETWDNDTTAVFIDSSTGEPPSGLVADAGIKTIQYYQTKDFSGDFPGGEPTA